jgi:hypothetical protein
MKGTGLDEQNCIQRRAAWGRQTETIESKRATPDRPPAVNRPMSLCLVRALSHKQGSLGRLSMAISMLSRCPAPNRSPPPAQANDATCDRSRPWKGLAGADANGATHTAHHVPNVTGLGLSCSVHPAHVAMVGRSDSAEQCLRAQYLALGTLCNRSALVKI